MSEQDKKNQALKAEHMSFPDPRCELHFQKSKVPILDSLAEIGHTVEMLVTQYEKTSKTIHGENYDNGMVQAVREHTLALQRFEKLPDELRRMVLKWGFYLLGANGIVSTVAITILIKILEK